MCWRRKKNALFWPRPIFAGGEPPTIVSAEAFQDSVRDGKSWYHLALETRIKRSNARVYVNVATNVLFVHCSLISEANCFISKYKG